MAQTWFECKLKYDKRQGEEVKSVTELYLVEADSFTDAESRISERCGAHAVGEFNVDAVKRTKVAEIFTNPKSQENYWFKITVQMRIYTEENKRERFSNSDYYVTGDDIVGAVKFLEEQLGTTMNDAKTIQAVMTKILDVFPYTVETPAPEKLPI